MRTTVSFPRSQQGHRPLRTFRTSRHPLLSRGSRFCAARASDKHGEADKEPSGTPASDARGEGAAAASTSSGPGGDDAPEDASLQIPAAVIKRMRDTVFGFDTFFVTSTENYQADGVLFKGNLRGDPAVAYGKMEARLKKQLGEDYTLFLLQDKEETPVVVVLPSSAVVPQAGLLGVWPLAGIFAAVTLVTTLGANGVPFLAAFITGDASGINGDSLAAAVPGTVATFAILAAHEVGHIVAARKAGAQLAPPILIPAGLGIIGSFGAVTAFRGPLADRNQLLRIGTAGPLYGALAAGTLTALGLGLSAAGIGPAFQVETGAFNDCLLMGVLGQLTFGSRLYSEASLQLSPILLAGWAGLVINGLNAIPIGELDGGRIVHGIWGRRAAGRVSTILTLVLGLTAIVDSLALYWILLVLTLQRGPILPQKDEISVPQGAAVALAVLALPLLTLIPYPGDVTSPGF